MNKKGGLGIPEMLGVLFLVLLVTWGLSSWFGTTKVKAATKLDMISMKDRHQLCKIAGQKYKDRGEKIPEPIESKVNKEDGFPDECDLCLGGNDNQADNIYDIPNDCYFSRKKFNEIEIKNYRDMCVKVHRGCYISDTEQCCLKETRLNIIDETGKTTGSEKISCPSKCK